MAESKMADHWEKVKEELTCPICRDLLTAPKILSCLHSYCTSCLQHWLERTKGDTQFECPLCRAPVTFSGDIENLPTHFSAARLIEIINLQEQATCEVVPKCNHCVTGEDAVAACTDCHTLLCDFCRQAHSRFKTSSSHQVVSLEELKAKPNEAPDVLPEKKEMCPHHPTKSLKLFCRCRDVLICRDCVLTSHKDHDYDFIHEAVGREKEVLQNAVPGIEKAIVEVEKATEEIKAMKIKQKEKGKANLIRLNDAFHTLQTALEQRRKQMEDEIKMDADNREKMLGTQEAQLTFLLAQLKGCRDFFLDKLKRGVSHDILSMKKQMVERSELLETMKNEAKLSPAAREQDTISFLGLEKIIHTFRNIGSFVDLQKTVVAGLKENGLRHNDVNRFEVSLVSGSNVPCFPKEIDIRVQYFAQPISELATIEPVSEGLYQVSYNVRHWGGHLVCILVDGDPVPGSPFKVTAELRNYQIMKPDDCQIITEYNGKKFSELCDVCTGPNDDVFLLDKSKREVISFDSQLDCTGSFSISSFSSKVSEPAGLAVQENVIAVSDSSSHVVKLFTLQGKCQSTIGAAGSGDGQFDKPCGVVFVGNKLYVVDSGNHRIQCFVVSPTKFIKTFGTEGRGPGQLLDPHHIAADSDETLYVADCSDENKCITVFNKEGAFVYRIKCEHVPFTVAVSPDGYVLADDHESHSVTVFTSTGDVVVNFGTNGSEQGQFGKICGLSMNSYGAIYIVDCQNHHLQVIWVSNYF